MKYTAKRIIDRALSLVDLHNTDFLSHQELTDYLNDSWKSLYQISINSSDKVFVCETALKQAGGISEYCLPDYLY